MLLEVPEVAPEVLELLLELLGLLYFASGTSVRPRNVEIEPFDGIYFHPGGVEAAPAGPPGPPRGPPGAPLGPPQGCF